MTPESAAREWLDSAAYEHAARETIATVYPQTIEEYTRGDEPHGLSVQNMHLLFERIFVAGAEWARRERP